MLSSLINILIRSAVLMAGLAIIILTLSSAIQTFVLPRSVRPLLTRWVFLFVSNLFRPWIKRAKNYYERDQAMALYAPVSLLVLPVVWLMCVTVGYTAIYWVIDIRPLYQAFTLSGSALLTLGFAIPPNLFTTILVFSEATMGLILVALLISYLPTMYAAFAKREAAVTLLEVRAGSPPSALEMLSRASRLHNLHKLGELWPIWENWFVEIEESHSSLAALVFFRSPKPDRSWITAAGAVLDTASLLCAVVDVPADIQAQLCIRAGYLALRHIADFFQIPYNAQPKQGDPISISRQEFDEVCQQLLSQGVPLKEDREQAWLDFAGWRVNYDTVLIALCQLISAPYAPWSSDRSIRQKKFLSRRY